MISLAFAMCISYKVIIMLINTTKHSGTNSHLQGSGRRHKSNSSSRYLGAEGTLTGTLSMTPLAYHKQMCIRDSAGGVRTQACP